jgi:hypothetical protein
MEQTEIRQAHKFGARMRVRLGRRGGSVHPHREASELRR